MLQWIHTQIWIKGSEALSPTSLLLPMSYFNGGLECSNGDRILSLDIHPIRKSSNGEPSHHHNNSDVGPTIVKDSVIYPSIVGHEAKSP